MARLLTFLLLFESWIILSMAGTKIYKLERVGNCLRKNSSATRVIDFSTLKGENGRDGFKMGGYINVSRDIKGILNVLATGSKCLTSAKRCNEPPLMSYFNRNYCFQLEDNKYLGDTFVKKFKPPFICPLKAGTYHTTNFFVDLSWADILPFDLFRWDIVLDFYEQSRNKRIDLEDGEDGSRGIPIGCWSIQMTRTNKRMFG